MGIKSISNLQIKNRTNSINQFVLSANDKNELENLEIVQRYLDLNNTPTFSNIVIKKSMPSQKQPITISNPNSSANGSNSSSGHQPLFIHNEDEYKEYQRQKELIDAKINIPGTYGATINTMHLVRGLINAHSISGFISSENRKNFLNNRPSVEMSKGILIQMEQNGYLDIQKKRQKYHDYKPSQKAFDDWNSLKLYEPLSRDLGASTSEHYLMPFDPKVILEANGLTITPQEVDLQLSNFHLIPCGDRHIAIMGDHRTVDFIDFKDINYNQNDIDTIDHKQLFKYIGAPNIAQSISTLAQEASKGRGIEIQPKYFMDNGIVFKSKNNEHFLVPTQAVNYIYNKYFDEDIKLEILPSNVRPILTETVGNRYYGYRNLNDNRSNKLFVAKRVGESAPLFAYRFAQIDTELATVR